MVNKINNHNKMNSHELNRGVLRRCSLCRVNGHYISSCNSNILITMEETFALKTLEMNTKAEFKNWLEGEYLGRRMLLKAFVHKKFNLPRIRFDIAVALVTIYIYHTYVGEDDDENELIAANPQALTNEMSPRGITEIEEVSSLQSLFIREMMALYNQRNGMSIEEDIKFSIKITLIENENKNENCECSICYDETKMNNFVKFDCKHEFCKDCVVNTLKNSNNNLRCALCRSVVKEIETTSHNNSELFSLIK